MDTYESDTFLPLLNILKSDFMITHCEAHSSYHTNFLRDKVSREITRQDVELTTSIYLNPCNKRSHVSVALIL